MKRGCSKLAALLLALAMLAALTPAALAGNEADETGGDAYRIAVNAVPAVVTAGEAATVLATVYQRSQTAPGGWTEYQDGGAVITWEAYRQGIAAFRGEASGKPVTTTLQPGTASASMELLTQSGSVTASVQLPLSVSLSVGGKRYFAAGASVIIEPPAAEREAEAVYAAGFSGSVRFSEADFSRAFSAGSRPGETLDHVTFALSEATVLMDGKTYNLCADGSDSMFGWLYTSAEGTQKLSDADVCYYQASFSQLDLDALTYLTGSCRTQYTVRIPYNAVGTAGTSCGGAAAVTVSGDNTVTAAGAALKTLDAAGQIMRAFPDAACVSFRQPAAATGRLFYDFRTLAGGAYTAVRYAGDRFYLDADGKQELLLGELFFLPAADCASQLKLAYTAYDASGAQLGTGELPVLVASKTASAVFPDVNAGTCAWAAAAVDFMHVYGLVRGAGAEGFHWKGSMTRGDFILILYRNAGLPAVSGTECPYTDVAETDYAHDAIVWAWQNGVAGGVSDTAFGPRNAITREQIASILYRLSGKPAAAASLRSYTDASAVSAYAESAMRWAVGSGYLKGSGAKLSPQSTATRAEVAVLLHRYLTK